VLSDGFDVLISKIKKSKKTHFDIFSNEKLF
jgi:hypothetical protein